MATKPQPFYNQYSLRPKFFSRLLSILSHILILLSALAIAAYLWTALHRIAYPYELEWMEGAIVDECGQLLNGSPLYREPDLQYVPFIYPPLYFLLSAAAMRIFGLGFLAPRLVSLLASFGTMVLLYAIIKRETNLVSAGVLSAGLFAAAYRATGSWMDIARVDSLFIFWIALGAFVAGRRDSGLWAPILTAVLLSAAFFTKQVALAPALAIGVYYISAGWKRFLLYLGALALFAGGGTLLLNACYGGWYVYYVFLLSSRHAIRMDQVRDFLYGDIIGTFPVMFGLSLVSPLLLLKDRRPLREGVPGMLYYLLGASLFLVSLVGRGNVNSYVNTLLPAAFAFALLCGWTWGRVSAGKGRGSVIAGPAVGLCLAVQFIMLGYLPAARIPRDTDRQAGDILIAYIKSVEGDVLLPFHGYLPRLAGKESSAHWTAVLDLLLAMKDREGDPARLWLKEFERAIREGRYDYIILDREDWFPGLLKSRYARTGTIFGDAPVFYPVTGYPWRPQFIYRKISPPPHFNGEEEIF
ncbi:MAG: glycosyltransferase family 39 protein [PVC group bacterium]